MRVCTKPGCWAMPSLRYRLLRLVFIALCAVLIGIATFTSILYSRQTELMYFPPSGVSVKELEADFKPVTIETEDKVSLTGYFHAPEKGMPLLLLFHGNANHPAWVAFRTRGLRERGYGVLLAEYRGFSNRTVKPSELGLYKDAEAYIRWIEANYNSHPLVLYGESLGTAVAIEMATRHDVSAIVLEVPFKSAVSVAQSVFPFVPWIGLIMRDPYRSDLKIGKVKAPVLFLLAGEDEVVSYASGLALYELANQPKTKIVYQRAGHTNVYDFDAEQDVMKFLKEAVEK